MMSQKTKAIVISLLCAAILTPSLFIPRQAHAIPTTETNPAVVGGIVATAANQTVQTTIMKVLDGLAWSMAKMTVQSLTRSMVNWINSGFQGSPAFVSDLRENLLYLGDAVADDFLNQLDSEVQSLTGFNLRTPFQDQISQKLREEYYRTTSSWGVNEYYNLYKDSTDPKAFVQQGKFSKGGFNAWFSTSQNPANNPFGAYQLASNQLWSQIDSAAQARKAELDWGRGFLPWRGNCNKQAGNNTNLSKTEGCLFAPNKTPGALVESALGINITSPLRQLELADSINEIVAALMGQMVSQVLGGVGLTGLSQPSSGGGRSFLEQATDQGQYQQLNTSLSNGILTELANTESSINAYKQNWQEILDLANRAEARCGTSNSVVGEAKRRAQAAIAKANTALQEVATMRAKIQTAQGSTSTSRGTEVAATVADYQAFISSSSVPTPQEIAEAEFEGADTRDEEGNAVANSSLYTKLSDLIAARSCVVR